MSKIESIGKKLYGDSWQAQLSRDLKNEDGDSIARQTIQSWHSRDSIPNWVKEQLIQIFMQRKIDIDAAIIEINNL